MQQISQKCSELCRDSLHLSCISAEISIMFVRAFAMHDKLEDTFVRFSGENHFVPQ
jgi:hypothetical protein